MELTHKIVQAHQQSRCTYGSPRVHATLVSQGESVSVNTVSKLMKQAGDAAVASAVSAAEVSGAPIAPLALTEVKSQSDTWISRLELWATADLDDPANEVAQFQRLRRVEVAAERDALRDAYERGAFSSEAIERVRNALDSEEISLDAVDGQGAD